MSRSTQWLSLVAGIVIFGYGIMKLFNEGDWVLFVLGLLIVAFSVSKMVKTGMGGGPGSDRKD
ncbi:MAG: hypothetical protein WAW37_13580 [Syntrophobacteraceae bacterium]